MNEEQYLLVCVAEEAAELAQAALKAARFGLDDGYYERPELQPRQMLKQEGIDVLALLFLLRETGIIPESSADLKPLVDAKKAKVKKFMEYSRERGRLQ